MVEIYTGLPANRAPKKAVLSKSRCPVAPQFPPAFFLDRVFIRALAWASGRAPRARRSENAVDVAEPPARRWAVGGPAPESPAGGGSQYTVPE